MARVNISNVKVSQRLQKRLLGAAGKQASDRIKKATKAIEAEIRATVKKELEEHPVARRMAGSRAGILQYDLPAELGIKDSEGAAITKQVSEYVSNSVDIMVDFSPNLINITVRLVLPGTESFGPSLANEYSYTSEPSGEEIKPMLVVLYPWQSLEEEAFGGDVDAYSIIIKDSSDSRSGRATMVFGPTDSEQSRYPYTSPAGARPERRSQENYITESLSSKNIRSKLDRATRRALRTK